MKACIIQPPYSRDVSFSDEYFDYKIKLLDECDESVDIIVLPEYSDVPCATSTLEETLHYHDKYIDLLLDKCKETATRCKANVFVNALSLEETGYRNTTYVYNKNGELAGKYFKKHLPPLELEVLKLDSDYTFEFSEPYTVDIDGIRYGFLTCYDFYFYEAFANIARRNVDIIIGCSLQRSDSHSAIETMCRHLAYNTNAYVVRSSVSFSEDSEICGASMVVSPEGKVLENMKGRFGKAIVEFDPSVKYLKPAGYGNPDAPHYEYIEYGRKPWQYRQSGSAVCLPDNRMSYPRVCAHRGFSAVAPENSMAAFGAAVAMGADEIEFDLWHTKDGEIVSIHDAVIDRVSDGSGTVTEMTYDELRKCDFGVKTGESFKGMKIIKFEEILKKLGCQTVMNIHVKTHDDAGKYDPEILDKIVKLIDKYDCRKHVYFMSCCDDFLRQALEKCPDIARCRGMREQSTEATREMIDSAVKYKCSKVQFFKPYYNDEFVKEAHDKGLVCNIFWSDDPIEAKEMLEAGFDTVLTNEFNLVNNIIKG